MNKKRAADSTKLWKIGRLAHMEISCRCDWSGRRRFYRSLFRLSFDPAGEAKTRASYESGVSWHVIPADILSAMKLPSHKNSLRRNGRHTDGISPFTQGKYSSTYCRLPRWLCSFANPSFFLMLPLKLV